ncbi:hypothetical protein FLJC2902T_11910 [Flavobacterium limnosediminis JC2902]|uniref:Uncharacterized protein n=1 Tax=Flavobacterium limnosediminis JC2902 TaxID=1341181 RepID=V6SXP0_9FLAO|nr:hypothetical protein [Flavobacterium limnosediminis]ESU29150.1 hypothetical protein FLJC2902T_11910 [Flavobacterium limnosediminis JC2902]
MRKITKIAVLFMGLTLFSCSTEEQYTNENNENSNLERPSGNPITKNWEFNDLNEWQDASQNSAANYYLESGNLKMFTNPNTWERTKIKTTSTYGAGIYTWRVYAPEMGVGDMSSIGAFLYKDDTHELDFEIGYGSQSIRQSLNAQADDLVVYMTSQANPSISVQKTIKRNQWYNLSIELSLTSGNKYFANWKINGTSVASGQLNYGTKAKFKIFCSMENLTFIGDHIPQNQNYALFDSVTYMGF